ncbi:hypothetical protein BBJ28_00024179 [Nothophytophthora sp. Chile5]|nr:hypothetical protein BBJ28_00024179 [Nothophytophthora sp. Chile5]
MTHPTAFAATIALLSSSSLITSVDAREEYVALLPNGANVPGVAALGHVNPDGGGRENSFGRDFQEMGMQWTKELCKADSDNDGQTNGQELGDPCCEWSETSAVLRWTEGVSHPGDASKMSDASLWAGVHCSNATSTTVNASSTSGDYDSGSGSEVGVPSSAAATATPAPSSTAATGAASSVTLAATVGAFAMLLALAV